MAYSKHIWRNGETITAEKLDNLECGIDCLANCSCIWRNEQPESTFAAQEIALDTTQYSTLELYFIIEDKNALQTVTAVLNKKRAYLDNGKWNLRVKYDNYERYITITDDYINFSDCKYGATYNGKLVPTSIHAFE